VEACAAALSRLYTRQGDGGYTWCARAGRGVKVSKSHPCVGFVGALDEAEAAVGLARSMVGEGLEEFREVLLYAEELLFRVGFTFSTRRRCVAAGDVKRLEELIDKYSSYVEPAFVMSPDYPAAAAVNLARAVVRRAEREYWACIQALGEPAGEEAALLNRLSDLLYALQAAMARKAGVRLRHPRCGSES